MQRATQRENPPGDVFIRTRQGAFLLVECSAEVARELYSGVDESKYVVTGVRYRIFMTLGAVLMMPSAMSREQGTKREIWCAQIRRTKHHLATGMSEPSIIIR